jgi:hypothetical protein
VRTKERLAGLELVERSLEVVLSIVVMVYCLEYMAEAPALMVFRLEHALVVPRHMELRLVHVLVALAHMELRLERVLVVAKASSYVRMEQVACSLLLELPKTSCVCT